MMSKMSLHVFLSLKYFIFLRCDDNDVSDILSVFWFGSLEISRIILDSVHVNK